MKPKQYTTEDDGNRISMDELDNYIGENEDFFFTDLIDKKIQAINKQRVKLELEIFELTVDDIFDNLNNRPAFMIIEHGMITVAIDRLLEQQKEAIMVIKKRRG